MAGIYRDPRPKIRHTATIWGVYVNPAWRGLKMGERLMQACLDWARSHEVIFVRLGVNHHQCGGDPLLSALRVFGLWRRTEVDLLGGAITTSC